MAIFRNICIIDDDDLFLLVSKSIMEDEDFAESIHNFEDGREALDYLKSTDNNTIPEVLFLDINMPMMDGWEFLEALDDLKFKGKMNIYITSSSINPADLKAAQKNPMIKDFISKPIVPEKLKKIAKESQ